MSNVLKMLSRGGAAAAETDPNFNQTVLLLHGDGTNGAQNNTFLDSSTNNFTITRNGNTTQGTFSPFSAEPGKWSNYFASGDNLTFTEITQGSTWTIEFWYMINASGNNIVTHRASGGDFWLGIYASDIRYAYSTNTRTFSYTSAVNTWYHLAMVNNAGTLSCYINGVQIGTSQTGPSTSYVSKICGYAAGFQFAGYISNLRITSTAVYTSNFTPNTSPLGLTSGGQNPPTGSQTVLLTCQQNRFVAAVGGTITVSGTPRITPFSPFAPTAAYDAGTNGGSGYFDGSGARLNTPTSSQFNPAGDFTIGLWFYPNTALTINQNLVGNLTLNVGTDWLIQMVSGTLNFYTNGTTVRISSATAIRPFEWNYITMTRSSNVISAHVNGTLIGTYSQSGSFGSASKTIEISNSISRVNGFISGLILIDGTADTTVPTAPPTNVSGTSLLLNFTNAGIFDQTGKNVLETVGNAQIDTTTKKFGTGSMKFDGNGDYLLIPKFWNIAASEDFTIECWVYLTAAQASYRAIISDINSANLGSSKYIMISSSGLEIQTGTTAGTISTITQSFSQNTWYHLAVVRSSNTISVYVDGVSKTVSQASQAGAFLDQGTSFYIGRWASTAYEFYGYIDDLRITKGVARYPTEPFPTKELPNQ